MPEGEGEEGVEEAEVSEIEAGQQVGDDAIGGDEDGEVIVIVGEEQIDVSLPCDFLSSARSFIR